MKPIRIQRKRTKGWKMPENTIYVGRQTKYGNPFVVGKFVDANWFNIFDRLDQLTYFIRSLPISENCEAVYLFDKYFHNMNVDLSNLKGKNLACFCRPELPCHADSLLILANK